MALRLLVGCSVLVCAVLIWGILPPEHGYAQKKKNKKTSSVGESMAKIVPGEWFVGEPFDIQSLKGTPWVLVLVKVQSPRWADYHELFNRIHRDEEDGGPVVIAIAFDRKSRIEQEVADWSQPAEFFLASDKHGKVYGKYGTGVYPQFYVVDERGIVTWEGSSLDKSFQGVLQKLAAGDIPRIATGDGETSDGGGRGGKDSEENDNNARYKARIDKAIAQDDTTECIRLLRLAWKKDQRPNHELVGPLWDHIEAAIRKEAAPAVALMDSKKYEPARKQIAALRQRYSAFPSDALLKAWDHLASREGREWYHAAKKAVEDGHETRARALVDTLTSTYPDSKWAKKALELLP